MSNEHVIRSDQYTTVKLYEGPHYLNIIIDTRREEHPKSIYPNGHISASLYDEDLSKFYEVVRNHMIDRGLIIEPTETTWEAIHAATGREVYVQFASEYAIEGVIAYANSAHVAVDTEDTRHLVPWVNVILISVKK